VSDTVSAAPPAAWVVLLIRGMIALALGVLITLTPNHGPEFGLLAFGAYGLLSGAVTTAGAARSRDRGLVRGAHVALGIVTLAAGIAALVLPGGGVVYFAALVGGWALVSGALELGAGFLDRSARASRDRRLVGGVTILLGLVLLLVPRDLAHAFAGEEGVSGTLTSSVILVGTLGAWAVIAGVLLTISAVSLRGQPAQRSPS